MAVQDADELYAEGPFADIAAERRPSQVAIEGLATAGEPVIAPNPDVPDKTFLDTFERTVAANSDSWGDADAGGAWDVKGYEDSSNAYLVDGTQAQIVVPGTSGRGYAQILGYPATLDLQDIDMVFRGSWDKDAAGNNISFAAIARFVSNRDQYRAVLRQLSADGTMELSIDKIVKNVVTLDINGSGPVVVGTSAYVPPDFYWLRFKLEGSDLKAKAWLDGTDEPEWMIETTDADIPGGGVGIRATVAAGTTDLPYTWTFDDFYSYGLSLSTTTTEFVTYAQVNWGRWIAYCPFRFLDAVEGELDEDGNQTLGTICRSAQYVAQRDMHFFCADCFNAEAEGDWIPIVWPEDPDGPQAIEDVLNLRPNAENQNWEPGETVADLEQENIDNGL